MSSIYPIPDSESGAAAIANTQTQLSILETMLLKDEATIANPTASVADKFTAFQELSGYINGTNSQFAALTSGYDAAQKAAVNAATMNVLSKCDDVEIPVGKDDNGNVVYKRVYEDAAQTKPATAADFVKAWEDTGANGTTKTSFYFSFTSKDIDMNNSDESWAGGASASGMTPSACHDDGSDTYNPQKEAGGGVTVDEHTEYSGQQDMNCSGDAQAIAAYCNYSNAENPNYNFSGAYDDVNKQFGF